MSSFPGDQSFPLLNKNANGSIGVPGSDGVSVEPGDRTNWPPALTNAVNSMKAAGYPVLVVWGNHPHVFCNETAAVFLQERASNHSSQSPDDLQPSVWCLLLPMIREAIATNQPGWHEDQLIFLEGAGKTQESYWTINITIITNEKGIAAGVQVGCNETTARVQLKKQTEEVTTQLNLALEAGDMGSWDLDPVTMGFRCNEKTKELFGLPAHENVDLSLAIGNIHADDRQKVLDAISLALHPASGGIYHTEYSIIHPRTGEERIVKAKGRAYFNSEGEPIKFSGVLHDVTTEARARRRSEKLQQLVERSEDFMAMATPEGRLSFLNAAGRKLAGLPDDVDAGSLRLQDFYSEDQYRMVQNEIIPALKISDSWSGVIRIRHWQNGEEIPCQGSYMLIRDGLHGDALSLSLTLKDLRPELVARKELEDSEKRFRNLVQEAPVATAIYVGPEMKIQWANDAMIKLWGKEKSVIGKTVRAALPELEGQPFHSLLDKVYRTGQIYQATEDKGDLVVDGVLQTFYFNFSYKPLRDTEGNVYGILNMAIDVTEQVTVKRRLEESERNFRNLIMRAPVGLCLLTGEDFTVELANDQYLELVGRQREGFVGYPIWEVVPEAKEQGFDKLLNGVRETGKAYVGNEQELYLVRNGSTETVYINFVYEPLFDENGVVYSVLVIAIDITPQVETRKKIENAEERARLAVESAKLGTYEWNLHSQSMHASKRFNEMFDMDDTAPHLDYVSHIHPDDRASRQAAHESGLLTGRLEYECRISRRDGTTNWLQIFGQFYFNDAGQPNKIIGIARDITEEKLAEQEKEKFLSLAHYSRDFIGMCDMNMKTLYVNRAGVDMLGIAGNVMDMDLWDCFYEEDHEFLRSTFFPAVQRNGHGEVEIRFRHFETHEAIWVIYSVFLIRDSKGEPVAMATVSRDITERKTMQQELERRVKERTEQLTKLNEELQQFTYVSSHDLKEPLRKIQLFAGMIKEEMPVPSSKISFYLDKVIGSAQRMSRLLTDLLNYSMLANKEGQYAPVDLNDVITSLEEDIEVLIREKNATIVKDHLPVIYGIPFQLNQLFYNLLNNALKFSREGVPPIVRVSSRTLTAQEKESFPSLDRRREYSRISVTDNGIGFSEEFAQKIFVVFQRLHERNEYSGNGIGLSICKKIAENHNGLIYATSTPGEGSEFVVLLGEGEGRGW